MAYYKVARLSDEYATVRLDRTTGQEVLAILTDDATAYTVPGLLKSGKSVERLTCVHVFGSEVGGFSRIGSGPEREKIVGWVETSKLVLWNTRILLQPKLSYQSVTVFPPGSPPQEIRIKRAAQSDLRLFLNIAQNREARYVLNCEMPVAGKLSYSIKYAACPLDEKGISNFDFSAYVSRDELKQRQRIAEIIAGNIATAKDSDSRRLRSMLLTKIRKQKQILASSKAAYLVIPSNAF